MSARRVPGPGRHAPRRLLAAATAIACAASLGIVGPPARAQTPVAAAPAADEARAEALLDEGRALMMEGRLDAACTALEQSHRLHDRGDTLLNLAECHRRQGRTATAWAEFGRAIEHADRVKFEEAMVVARLRRDELAGVLSTLTVTVPAEIAALEGLVVELDGAPLPIERWNQPAVRDPGAFTIAARANGYRPLVVRDELGAQKDQKTVVIALEKDPPPPTPTAPPPAPPPAEASTPLWPFVVGGVGVALLGASAGFGIASASAGSELDAACGDARTRCPESRRPELESSRATEIATFGAFVGLGAGGLLALGVAGFGLGLSLDDEAGGDAAADDGARPTTAITVGPTSLGLRGSFH